MVNRGELIGVISLAEVFGLPYSEKTELSTVIITDGINKIGVEVDQIIQRPGDTGKTASGKFNRRSNNRRRYYSR